MKPEETGGHQSFFTILLDQAKLSYRSTRSSRDIEGLFDAYPRNFAEIARALAETAVEIDDDRRWMSAMKASEARTGSLPPLYGFFLKAQEEKAERDLAGVISGPPPPTARVLAAHRIRGKIEVESVPCEKLEVSVERVRRGQLFDMSGTRVSFPTGEAYDLCYVGLVDPTRTAQWAHPAWWAFVPLLGDEEVVLQATEFPENATGSVRFGSAPDPAEAGAPYFTHGTFHVPCSRCATPYTEICNVPRCGIVLCDKHVRRDDDAPRCAKHEPYVRNRSKPRAPGTHR